MPENDYHFLRRQVNWENLYFYQKAKVLHALTYRFTERFLQRGDRTIDQMDQAARSGKQNIVEGSADGVTSTEMEVKLMNCARGSLRELREDYEDFLLTRGLTQWAPGHPRYDGMLEYCRKHNGVEDYAPYFDTWSSEEMANVALTLCHIADKLMTAYIEKLEKQFVTEGGIKERMHAARTGYRKEQDRRLAELEEENKRLREKLGEAPHS